MSSSVSHYRSISFGYPIVPAFSNPRLPASSSVKRMQLSTMPGLFLKTNTRFLYFENMSRYWYVAWERWKGGNDEMLWP